MDPKETLKLLLLAIAAGERAEAVEHLENLLNWIKGNGFLPDANAPFYMDLLSSLGKSQQWVMIHTHEFGSSLYPFRFRPEGRNRAPSIEKIAPRLLVSSFEPDKRETLDIDELNNVPGQLFAGEEFGCLRHLGPLNEGDEPITIPIKPA